MLENRYPIEKIKSLAGNLVNRKILNAESAGKGNNNKVYRIQTTDGFYALKIYSSQIGEPWDRLGTEFSALNFLYSNGFTCIPRAIAKDQKNNCALYQWIDGQPIASISNEELHIVVSFLLQISVGGQCNCNRSIQSTFRFLRDLSMNFSIFFKLYPWLV
mgnify:CR=1 FL=1